MPTDRSELSSIAELLEQLTRRISAMGEAAQAERDDTTATDLFSVERTLRGANRVLSRLLAPRR